MRPIQHNPSEFTRTASILILVLIVVSAMTILAVGLAYRTRLDIQLTGGYAQRTSAYYLALGGLERAKAELGRQLDPGMTPAAQAAKLCQLNTTAAQEDLFRNSEADSQVGYALDYRVQDEQGMFSINQPDTVAWANLKLLTDEETVCILDWIDADDDTGPGGAEWDYYEHQASSCAAKNSHLIALRELLFVKNITPRLYAGEARTQDSVGVTSADGSTPSPAGDRTSQPGVIDDFTVYGDGKININTASAAILAALPGYDEAAAQAILTYRAGPDGRLHTDDDVSIEPTDNLSSIPGLENRPMDYFCFASEYFRVYSHARLKNGIACALMATMKRTGNEVKVLYVERLY